MSDCSFINAHVLSYLSLEQSFKFFKPYPFSWNRPFLEPLSKCALRLSRSRDIEPYIFKEASDSFVSLWQRSIEGCIRVCCYILDYSPGLLFVTAIPLSMEPFNSFNHYPGKTKSSDLWDRCQLGAVDGCYCITVLRWLQEYKAPPVSGVSNHVRISNILRHDERLVSGAS